MTSYWDLIETSYAPFSGKVYLDLSVGVGSLDHEMISSYTLTVTTTDGTTTITDNIVVAVLDVNEVGML